MLLKPNLRLRKVGNRYMLVDVSGTDANTTFVHTLNESAAFVFECAEKYGDDAERIATLLSEEYNIDFESALSDTEELLSSWMRSGLFAV